MTANGEVQTREEATVHVKELYLFVTVMLLEETPAVLSLGKLCEDDGYTNHWTSGQKPHLTKKGKRINCKIANYVPFVVLSLSTSSSTSSSPASSTSSSQDTVISTENPAKERSEIVSEESRGNPSRGSAEKENTKKMKTTKNCEVNYCKIRRNGCRISRRIWLIRMFNHINTLPSLLMNYQWSRERKWYRVLASIVSFLTSRKTEIVTPAWGRKLQGLLAEDVLEQWCPKRKILVSYSPRITKFSVNRDVIIDTLLWYKIWQLSGYKSFSGNPKVTTEVPGSDKETKSHSHWQFFRIWQVLWRVIMESLYVNASPFWDKWDCWESSA